LRNRQIITKSDAFFNPRDIDARPVHD
jgi:hypothetical protein